MKDFKDMNANERKVLSACRNGWWLSGRYEARMGGHSRTFHADSIPMLYNQVSRWHERHVEQHPDAHLLVRCECPC